MNIWNVDLYIGTLFPNLSRKGNFSWMEYPRILKNIHPCSQNWWELLHFRKKFPGFVCNFVLLTYKILNRNFLTIFSIWILISDLGPIFPRNIYFAKTFMSTQRYNKTFARFQTVIIFLGHWLQNQVVLDVSCFLTTFWSSTDNIPFCCKCFDLGQFLHKISTFEDFN